MSHSDQKYRAVLLIGAPGSGKGTQGVTIGSLPRFFHCSCGDVFRTLDTRTPLGRSFVEYSSRGELVPDELTIELWRIRIDQCVDAHMFKPDIDHIVLDGIPRNVRQAELLEPVLDVRRVFHLHCGRREELVQRLKKRAIKDNRLDDANEEVIRHRLDTYDRETRPLLDYYGESRITVVDAHEPPVKVVSRITTELAGLGIGSNQY